MYCMIINHNLISYSIFRCRIIAGLVKQEGGFTKMRIVTFDIEVRLTLNMHRTRTTVLGECLKTEKGQKVEVRGVIF